MLPGGDFADQGLLVGDAAVDALGGEDAEFGFGKIKPAAVLGRVVPFEALDQPSGFGGRECLVGLLSRSHTSVLTSKSRAKNAVKRPE